MSYELGAIKYIIGVLLTVPGFISMYIFGGGFVSGLKGFFEGLLTLVSGGEVTEAIVNSIIIYFLTEHLPPTSIEQIILQSFLGATIAAILWYIAVTKRVR